MNDGAVNRGLARYRVRWQIALVFDQLEHEPSFYGKTYDLTLVGTGMLTDRDVFADSRVLVLLAIPPHHRDGRRTVIEIEARQIYSVYSGETSCFRLGLEFRNFKDDGLSILKEGLSYCNPVLEARSQDPFPTIFGGARTYSSTRSLDLAA